MFSRTLIVGTWLLVAGCSEDIVELAPAGGPDASAAAPSMDAGPDDAGIAPATELVFVAEEIEGPGLRLVGEALEPSALSLGIEVTGISKVYGVGFRIAYDPAVLRFGSMAAGQVFGSASGPLVQAKEARPGLLVGVVSQTGGARGLVATEGLKVASLRFELDRSRIQGGSSIELSKSGTFVIGDDGTELEDLERGSASLELR